MLFWLTLILSSHVQAWTCATPANPALGQAVVQAAQGLSCPQGSQRRQVHMTFDDGPSSASTPTILNELKRLNVPSTFFVSTSKIAASHPQSSAHRALVNRIMSDGHLLANHGHDHDAYDVRMNAQGQLLSPGMTPEEREEQIRESTRLLNQATQNRYSRDQPYQWFRFPYGRGALPSDAELEYMARRGMTFSATDRATRLREYRQQSDALGALGDSGYSHVLWNHDSMDSSYSTSTLAPSVLRDYVVDNLRRFCAPGRPTLQVALFHDVKPFNAEAVPVLIEVARCLGVQFVPASTVAQSQRLQESGTLITAAQIQRAPVDVMGELIASLSGECPTCAPDERTPDTKSCLSEYNGQWYGHCQGGTVSICFEGQWKSRTDAWENRCRSEGL